MSKYTIVRPDPDSRRSFQPLRGDAGDLLFFDTPDEAYQYYRKEHYWDTSDIELVQFHDFKLELIKETTNV